MEVRYEDMKIDKSLSKKYADALVSELRAINGLSDIEARIYGFESEFSKYIGRKFSVAVNSGTDALQLSLMALGVGKGDKVVIPAVTYSAVGYAVLYSGAEPIVVDVEGERFSMSMEALESALNKHGDSVKVVIAVHMFGFPCNIARLQKLREKYGFYIIEDVCQAESSMYNGKMLGAFFDMSCFSFSYYKPISSCGGGGGMVCFDEREYMRIKKVTEIWRDDYALSVAGKRFSSMYFMDYVAIRVKFKYIKQIIKSRKNAQRWYEEGLSLLPVGFIKERPDEFVVLQNFPIIVPASEDLGNKLKNKGVYPLKPYVPLSEMHVFKEYVFEECVNAKIYLDKCLHLPLFSFISREDVEYVVESVKQALYV